MKPKFSKLEIVVYAVIFALAYYGYSNYDSDMEEQLDGDWVGSVSETVESDGVEYETSMLDSTSYDADSHRFRGRLTYYTDGVETMSVRYCGQWVLSEDELKQEYDLDSLVITYADGLWDEPSKEAYSKDLIKSLKNSPAMKISDITDESHTVTSADGRTATYRRLN